MSKFRKRPVVIEAYQTDKELDIETLEGTMHASIGDWIITGIKGEQYPCKPDVFEKSYETVKENEVDLKILLRLWWDAMIMSEHDKYVQYTTELHNWLLEQENANS